MKTKIYALLVFSFLVGLVLLVSTTDAAGTVAKKKPGCCHEPVADGTDTKTPAADGTNTKKPTADGMNAKKPPADGQDPKPDNKSPSKCPISTYCTRYNLLLVAAVVIGIVFVVFFAKYFLPANSGKA
jgi:hypothetical protein